jgi:hypothetical protein
MRFEKGNPGRPKGSKNKSKVLRVEEYLEEKGLNPIVEIVELLTKSRMGAYDKAKVWLALQAYCQPKPRELTLIDSLPTEKLVGVKSFEEFCAEASYPKPFPAQLEMRAWIFDDELKTPRLLLGARGYGKTDYTTLMGSAYEIYRKPAETSILLITKSPERNAAILAEVQNALIKNGVTKFEVENSKEIRVPEAIGKDNSLSALTMGSRSFRGRHPKLAIFDDPVTPEDAQEATRRRVRLVYDEVYKLCRNIGIIGQPVHKFDLYEELRPILRKKEYPHGSIPELDEDLEAMRIAGVTEETIQASYLLIVKSDGKNPFDDLRYIDAYPVGTSVGFIDPSFRGNDYTALSIGRAFGDGVCIQGHAWKRAWDHCTEEIATRCKALQVRKLAIETNSLGSQPVLLMRQAFRNLNYGDIEIIGIDSTDQKHARIMAAGNFAKLIHLSRNSDKIYQDLVRKYEYGVEHDDPPDSLASLLKWIGIIRGKEKK